MRSAEWDAVEDSADSHVKAVCYESQTADCCTNAQLEHQESRVDCDGGAGYVSACVPVETMCDWTNSLASSNLSLNARDMAVAVNKNVAGNRAKAVRECTSGLERQGEVLGKLFAAAARSYV